MFKVRGRIRLKLESMEEEPGRKVCSSKELVWKETDKSAVWMKGLTGPTKGRCEKHYGMSMSAVLVNLKGVCQM